MKVRQSYFEKKTTERTKTYPFFREKARTSTSTVGLFLSSPSHTKMQDKQRWWFCKFHLVLLQEEIASASLLPACYCATTVEKLLVNRWKWRREEVEYTSVNAQYSHEEGWDIGGVGMVVTDTRHRTPVVKTTRQNKKNKKRKKEYWRAIKKRDAP